MSERSRSKSFPALPLMGAGALVALALTAASVGRLSSAATPQDPAAPAAERDIRVADGANGAVLVFDARDGRQIEAMTGENGFLRGILRAMARERRMDGIGAQHSFRLTAWADGRLTLDDPTTGQRIELEAFGSSNAAVFARFLPQSASQGKRT